jgi:hypothetical protein
MEAGHDPAHEELPAGVNTFSLTVRAAIRISPLSWHDPSFRVGDAPPEARRRFPQRRVCGAAEAAMGPTLTAVGSHFQGTAFHGIDPTPDKEREQFSESHEGDEAKFKTGCGATQQPAGKLPTSALNLSGFANPAYRSLGIFATRLRVRASLQ